MEDEVLKAHLERQQKLGKLIQESQNRIGEYETALIDITEPSEINKYNRRKDDLKKSIDEWQEEIKSLTEKIKTRQNEIQSLNELYLNNLIDKNRKDLQVTDNQSSLLSRILNPFLRGVESRLRSNSSYWEESSFPRPAIDKSYTISYFSLVWEKLDLLLNQLQTPDYKTQQLILQQISTQFIQVCQLIDGNLKHQFAITLDMELQRVNNEIKAAEKTFRKIRFIKLRCSEIPMYLLENASTQIASLQISLGEIKEEFKSLIDEAIKDSPFIT